MFRFWTIDRDKCLDLDLERQKKPEKDFFSISCSEESDVFFGGTEASPIELKSSSLRHCTYFQK